MVFLLRFLALTYSQMLTTWEMNQSISTLLARKVAESWS